MTVIATYNILHGYHKDLILNNIKILIEKDIDIICLQEADISFEAILNNFFNSNDLNSWRIEYVHEGIAANLAFVWNTSKVELKGFEIIMLPTIKPVFIQKIKGSASPLKRIALVGTFLVQGKILRITNIHLAWEGGQSHRLKQLHFIKEKLNPDFFKGVDVIVGDFNTFGFLYSRLKQQKQVESLLHEYKNALPNLKWTCDISYTAPEDKWESVATFCRLFRIKLRTRLDYIFARNVKITDAQMLDLSGSDHRPLLVTFKN
ncbi:MAG: endonuclease/exonuclease/phosphatase family protein [Patescibacteria group bacterium]